MITCNEALELLSAQLDGAITIEEQTALQEHLAACPECRRIQSELKMAEEALPKLQQEPPKLLHDAVMQETRRKKERKTLLRFVGVMAAAAALLAVLAGFKLVSLPGFDHGEAAVSMGDSLFPKTDSARKYAEELSKQTGCRVILVEHCTPEALGGGFAKLDNGIYRRELSEAELDELEANLDSSYAMIICGAKGDAEDSAYLLCTD
mgnify:FL=1